MELAIECPNGGPGRPIRRILHFSAFEHLDRPQDPVVRVELYFSDLSIEVCGGSEIYLQVAVLVGALIDGQCQVVESLGRFGQF